MKSLFTHVPLRILLLILPLLVVCSPRTGISQEMVDEGTALLGALHYAGEVFGELAHVNTQLFVDLDNRPQVYVFVLCHSEFPASCSATSSNKPTPVFSSDDDSRFVTVVAGANKAHVPVIEMYRGLPDYIVNMAKIGSALTRQTGDEGWHVVRYLFPAPFEFWLEAEMAGSPSRLFIRANDMYILDQGEMERFRAIMRRARRLKEDGDRSDRLRGKWDFIKTLRIKQTLSRGR